MAFANEQHPDNATLAAFLDGRLDEASRIELEEHIGRCAVCCRQMDSLPIDLLSSYTEADADGPEVAWSIASSLAPDSSGHDADIQPTEDRADSTLPDALREHPRYEILELLGRGGMGLVYKARHRVMGRLVAIKVIDPRLVQQQALVDRFHKEVRAAALLSHPNIVRAYDAEQAGDYHFLVMEYVDGESLAEFIARRGPLTVRETLGVVRKVAQGLQHASRNGMVHRDIKPQNLMVTRAGRIRILDFGLARLVREADQGGSNGGNSESRLERTAQSLTLQGMVLGTPDYMAPEQVDDPTTADTRADIYSLGCTAWYLLTGQPPYPGGTVMQKLLAHRNGTLPSLTSLVTEATPRDVKIIITMMARQAADRYQTPADVVRAVEAWPTEPETITTASAAPSALAGEPAAPEDFEQPPGVSKASARRVSAERVRLSRRVVLIGGALLAVAVTIFVVAQLRPGTDAEGSGGGQQSAVIDESEIAPQAGLRDLLAEVEPARDALSGSWLRQGDAVLVQASPGARLQLPIRASAAYELEVELTREAGEDSVAILFPMEGSRATVEVDAWRQGVGGLQSIEGRTLRRGDGNPTRRENRRLVNGRRYRLRLQVTHRRVQAWLDDSPLVDWEGDPGTLSLIDEWPPPEDPRSIALGIYDSSAVIHALRYRELAD